MSENTKTGDNENRPLSDIEEQALYSMVEIDGFPFVDVAKLFGLSSARAAREAYDRVCEANRRLHGTINEARRAQQFKRYDEIFRQSKREFQETKLPKTTTTTKTDAGGNLIGTETKVEQKDGDPRMLRLALDSAKSIDDLFGLAAPKSVKVDSHSTHEININYDAMPLDELEKRAALATLRRQGLIVLDQVPGLPALPQTENSTPHQYEAGSAKTPALEEFQTQEQTHPEGSMPDDKHQT